MPRRQLPQDLCIDEVHVDISRVCNYAMILQDFETGEPVDMIANRRKEITEPYFLSIPFAERKQVKYLISDMYRPYTAYVDQYFPNAVSIVDCFDGMLTSWTIGSSPNSALVNKMLDKAVEQLNENEHPIIHSDRGCHYRWPGWIERVENAGLERSMSQKGCPPDNAACEGLFGRIKNEMFYNRDWYDTSIQQFIGILNEYLIWYNDRRIKESLGYMSPREYRQSLGLVA